MKRILSILILGMLALSAIFAQVPAASEIDGKVYWNNAFSGTTVKILSNTTTASYRIQCTERAYLGVQITADGTNAFCDVQIIPSFYENNVSTNTNYNSSNAYYSYTNAPAVTVNIMNPNGALYINQYHSITMVTQAYIANTTNLWSYPCRTAIQDYAWVFPQYLQNTRTYMLVISNSTGTTNTYRLKFLLWKP